MYVAPQIEDYGTLEELTADISLLSPHGIGGTIAAVTGPLGGGGPGGGQGVQGAHNSGSGDVGDLTSGGGGGSPSGDVSPGSAGGGAGSGGAGAGGAVGGHAAQLPFTGFPAAFAGAVGGVMAASGAALRRALRPSR